MQPGPGRLFTYGTARGRGWGVGGGGVRLFETWRLFLFQKLPNL